MAFKKLDNLIMKETNKKNVLRLICQKNEISRKQLSELTGLTNATITNLTQELIAQNLILESHQAKSQGGRKPQILAINPTAGYIIGLELSTSNIICVLTDFSPKIIDKIIIKINIKQKKEIIIKLIIKTILEIIQKNNIPKQNIFGIGFASAGPYNRETGTMINPPNFPGWNNVPITQIISEATGIKTLFEKETPAIALAEYWFGKNQGYKRAIAINIYEVGIGAGFVIDGDIYHGNTDAGMEIGHTVVLPHGQKCRCGNQGCLEMHADGAAAVRYVQETITQSLTNNNLDKDEFKKVNLSMKDVIRIANTGNAITCNAISKCAYYCGIALGNIIGIISPDIIYIGGPFAQQCPDLFKQIVEIINKTPYINRFKDLIKAEFSFGELSGAMGGVAIVYSEISKT